MRLDPAEARDRFAAARVVRLATSDADGAPHLVPCTFAMDGSGRIVIGIDNKPKASRNLKRMRNIAANPRVSVLADHYSEDWEQLWWARADGMAAIEPSGDDNAWHWELLRRKYPQYEAETLTGPVIAVTVSSWTGWAFS
jgi:PPOX class probable F420-dependent enzyme